MKYSLYKGGDLFEIDTGKPYDKDYYVCIEEAKKELHEGARPELKKYMGSLDSYDTIFVGASDIIRTRKRFPKADLSFF